MTPILSNTKFVRLAMVLIAYGWLLGSMIAVADDHRILPASIMLFGKGAKQQLSAVTWRNQRIGPQVESSRIVWDITDPSIATIEDSRVVALGDGQTTINGTITDDQGNQIARLTTTVEVVDTSVPRETSFRNDVQSILARQGCNSGACHGALAGKGGFRLSLHGYDANADWFAITRSAQGRRVELADPGQSLLLTKPTGAVAHKGGIRLSVDSDDYRMIAHWIASSAKKPNEHDPILEYIVVHPEQSLLAPHEHQQVLVTAHYNNGKTTDVTQWTKFSASNEAVAAVDASGRVTVRGSGEGAVVAWFGSKISLSRVSVPFPSEVAEHEYQASPTRNFIDKLVLSKLRELHLLPGDRCDDGEFIRRIMIDTIGRLPTQQEVESFVADTELDKRDRLIDSLLERPEFVDYWTYKWSDLLLVNGNRLRPAGVKSFYMWIRHEVEGNTPWDQFVDKILTAQGLTTENGATNFFALHQDPEAITENACQAFLGLSIGCAKCHNHPLEKWTNDQYYAMANLFARVRGKGWGGDSRNGDGIRTVYVASEGELIQPRLGKPQPPTPLDGVALSMDDPRDRREHLSAWLTGSENPYFARSIVNRVWANFFAVGLVEAVDDLRLSNPASNEPLLNATAEYLVQQKFDLKHLMRTILQSETYQRTSRPDPRNASDSRFYSRYYPRRMMAEVILDGIDQVLDTHSKFEFVAFPGADRQKTDFYPAGTRAIQLYDAAVESYFLQTFGRNSREITCECERSVEPSMVQVLHLANGETLNPKLMTSQRIEKWVKEKTDDKTVIDQLFQLALARKPSSEESTHLFQVLAEYVSEDRRQALEDVCWSVLVNNEYVFNH